uniref:Putative CBM13 n=1 Tax=Magnetococcus massalia (strain MO-1) TaxID=451514 RepID=A0A1S7LKS9_MAGMO|nr:putative CBM13 [Candidatus Magnetococcus massalia]
MGGSPQSLSANDSPFSQTLQSILSQQGAPQQIVLGAGSLDNVVKKQGYLQGSITFKGQKTAALLFTLKNKKPILALLHDQFSAAHYLPQLAGTLLDQAKLSRVALLVVPPGSAGVTLKPSAMPAPLAKLVAKGQPKGVTLRSGVNLLGLLDASQAKGLSALLKRVKISSKKLLPIRGTFSASHLQLQAPLPTAQIAALKHLLKIQNPRLTLRGGKASQSGEFSLDSHIEGAMALALMGKKIVTHGALSLTKGSGKSVGLALSGHSDSDWKNAFGLPFLELNDIGFEGRVGLDAKGYDAVELALTSASRVGMQKLKSKTQLQIAKGKLVDIALKIPGRMDLHKLPGIGKIPGLNELQFRDITLSLKAITGGVQWRRIGGEGRVAIIDAGAGNFAALLRVSDLVLGKLIPGKKRLPGFHDIRFPTALLSLSSKRFDNLALEDLPPAVGSMLQGMVDDPAARIPIYDGLGLMGALDEKLLPKDLRRVLKETGVLDGVKGPLLLSGGVANLFSGSPMVSFAARLPAIHLPKNQPLAKVISLQKFQGEFFMRAKLSASPILQAGAAGSMVVGIPQIPHNGKSDRLNFRGELYGSLDLVSPAGSIKMGGSMQGVWNNPLGMQNISFKNPAVVFGVDTEGSLEAGVGGDVIFQTLAGKPIAYGGGKYKAKVAAIDFDKQGKPRFNRANDKRLSYSADLLVNINFSTTLPLPKKLGFRLKAKALSLKSYMDINDALLIGAMSGPWAELFSKSMTPLEKKLFAQLQAGLKKQPSSYQLLQLHTLPIPLVKVRDFDLYFATPGAVIPGREETMSGLGVRLAGKGSMRMMGREQSLGVLDVGFSLKNGLKVLARAPALQLGPLKLGPPVKHRPASGAGEGRCFTQSNPGQYIGKGLKGPVVDIAATLNPPTPPHFKIFGSSRILGAVDNVDIALDSQQIKLCYEKELPKLGSLVLHATSVGSNLMQANDFTVYGRLDSRLEELLLSGLSSDLQVPSFLKPVMQNSLFKPALANSRKLIASGAKNIYKKLPLYVQSAQLKASMKDFLSGKKGLTMGFDHAIFGEKMAPAVALVKPFWLAKDPAEALAGDAVIKAFSKSYMRYFKRHPVKLGRVVLPPNLVALEGASLTVGKPPKGSKSRGEHFILEGQVNALGLPFAKSRAYIDPQTERIVLNSRTTANLGLELKPFGKLPTSETLLHYEGSPKQLQNRLELKIGSNFFGQKDHLYMKLDGNLKATEMVVRLSNPCLYFKAKSNLTADAMGSVAQAVLQQRATPKTFQALAGTIPAVQLGDMHNMAACGERILKSLGWVSVKLNDIAGFAGQVAKNILGGISRESCNLARKFGKGDDPWHKRRCPWKSDCGRGDMGAHPWQSSLNRCWGGNYYLVRNMDRSHLCLDINQENFSQGEKVLAWPCGVKENQSFSFNGSGDRAPMKSYYGQCLGGSSYGGGVNLSVVYCSGGRNHRGWRTFDFKYLPSGLIQIIDRHSGRDDQCLVISGGQGSRISMDACEKLNKSRAAKWVIFSPVRQAVLPPPAKVATKLITPALRKALDTPVDSQATTAPFYHFETKQGHEFFTHDAQFAKRYPKYMRRAILGEIHTSRAQGTVPLLVFKKPHAKRTIFSYVTERHMEEYITTKNGWSFSHVAGYVHTQGEKGRAPIHMYRHRHMREMILVKESIDSASWKKSWQYWGIPGYLQRSSAMSGRTHSVFRLSKLVNNGQKLCADEESGSMTKGGKVIVWSCLAADENPQRQLFNHNSRGQIVSSNGLCLDLNSAKAKANVSLTLWPCYDKGKALARQMWRITDDAHIQHMASNLCIQAGKLGKRGGLLTLQSCRNINPQRWSAATILLKGQDQGAFQNAQLGNRRAGLCADEVSGTVKAGGKMVLWGCNTGLKGRKRQLFTHNKKGQIVSSLNGLCLDVSDPTIKAGMPIILWGCSQKVRQTWRMAADGHIQHKPSGMCISVESGGKKKSSKMVLAPCGNLPYQKWYAQPVVLPGRDARAFSRKQLANRVGPWCADRAGDKTAKGEALMLWSCNSGGDAKARQLFTHNNRGQLVTSNNLCVDLADPNVRDEAPIIFWGCNSKGASLERQRWRVTKDGHIQHRQSHLCLSALNKGNKGGKLVLSGCSNSPSQRWFAK